VGVQNGKKAVLSWTSKGVGVTKWLFQAAAFSSCTMAVSSRSFFKLHNSFFKPQLFQATLWLFQAVAFSSYIIAFSSRSFFKLQCGFFKP